MERDTKRTVGEIRRFERCHTSPYGGGRYPNLVGLDCRVVRKQQNEDRSEEEIGHHQ